MNPEKTGLKTSEFWLALIPQFVGILVVLGVVTTETGQQVIEQANAIVLALFALLAVLAPVVPAWKYIESRMKIKLAVMEKDAYTSDT